MKYFFTNSKMRVYKKIIFFTVLILSTGVLLTGCGPSAGIFKLVQTETKIDVQKNDRQLPNGYNIQETEFTLPSASKIDAIDYNDSLHAIITHYSEGKENKFLFYDLKENKAIWTANSTMSYSFMRYDDLILRDPKGDNLFDAPSGNFIRRTEPYLFLSNDGSTLLLSPDTFALVNVRTGKKIWDRPGHEWKGFRQQYMIGDWCYVIAEGLHALNLKEGYKWEYLTPNSYTNVGKEIAKQVALSCIASLAGGYNASSYNPDVTMNMNSAPLVLDNSVYFAARDKIVCLKKDSGKLIWDSQIDPELEAMDLYDISNDEIALVGTGIKILNFGLAKSSPPTIRKIKKDDGKITALFKMNQEAIVQDFASTNDNIFLLTPNQLHIFDKDLKLIGVTEAKKEYGNFTNILTTYDTIIIRASKGLVGLSKNTFSEIWFQYCELPPVEKKDEWLIPYRERLKINNESFTNYGYYWTPNESNGITAFDLENGKEILKINFYGKNIKAYYDKFFVDFENNKIKVMSIQ